MFSEETLAQARARNIRDALAEDIGRALGCGAHLASLRRTRFPVASRSSIQVARYAATPSGPRMTKGSG